MAGQSHFERLVDQKLAELVAALRNTPDTDHLKMVAIKNRMLGLEEGARIYREAARVDIDPDEGRF